LGSNDTTGFLRYPSGAYHRVIKEGTGRVPRVNDTVEFDIVTWFDGFDGHEKYLGRQCGGASCA